MPNNVTGTQTIGFNATRLVRVTLATLLTTVLAISLGYGIFVMVRS